MRKTLVLLAMLAFCGTAAAVDPGIQKNIDQALENIRPGLKADAVATTPVEGLYEVRIGAQIIYTTGDGRYLLQGDLVDLEAGKSLTEGARSKARLARLSALRPDQMLIFPAKGERRHALTVFTDIDCGYCRKLHQHMDEMNTMGIEVRYVFLPRSGLNTESYFKAVNAWCAENPREALTRAKQGEQLAKQDCENPVQEHLAVAEEFGISATPTMVTESGALVPGYVPPQQLLARLEAEKKK